jgi:hypothetical protein
MVVLALVLLIIVLVFSVAIVVSNPDVYQLSLFRVLVPVTSAGVFFTGFGAALVTIIALLLLRTGIRRTRETRRRLQAAEGSATGIPARSHGSSVAERSSDKPGSGPPDDRTPEHTGDPAGRPAGSTLDLDSGEDATTVPVERGSAERENDDRDEPRT